MIRILGIDPGSQRTGFGIIEQSGSNQPSYVTHGYVPTNDSDVSLKLLQIYQALIEVIRIYQPHEAAVEQIFMSQNPQSALKLGQARGAALVATAQYALPLAEYSPRQIKQAVVGYGAAAKQQVQHMVKTMLKMHQPLQADAADALAIAICHCQHRQYSRKLAAAVARETV